MLLALQNTSLYQAAKAETSNNNTASSSTASSSTASSSTASETGFSGTSSSAALSSSPVNSPLIIDAASLAGQTLHIEEGSTAILDLASANNVVLSGALNNNGTLIFSSSNPNVQSASITAASIFNNSGAFMGSANSFANLQLPGLFPITDLSINSSSLILNQGVIASAGNLALTAVGQINNTGTISSQANLSVLAASVVNTGTIQSLQNINLYTGNIANAAQMSAALGNINIASNVLNNVVINNVNGLIEANKGIINVRDAVYAGTGSLDITGGIISSEILNLNNGNGEIRAALDSISGRVNASGSCAQIGVGEGQLQLGNLHMTGDPTYFNNTGSITLDGNIQVGASLAILAFSDILSTVNATLISSTAASGQGSNIYLVAGASFLGGTGSTTTVPPLANAATSDVSIDPGTAGAGGNIDFSFSPNLRISSASTCNGCDAGKIVLAAYANGATGGRIIMPGPAPGILGTELNSTSASGRAGDVNIIAGAADGNQIQIGRIQASGGAGNGTVNISAAQPVEAPPPGGALGIITFNTQGQITTGNDLTASTTLNNVTVNLADNINAGQINISSGGDIRAVDAIVAQISTGAGSNPSGTAINKDGTFVYSVDSQLSVLYLINTANNTIVASRIIDASPGSQPSAVAISPDGSRVYVADQGLNMIHVYDASNITTEIGSFASGGSPNSLALNPGGSEIYVGSGSANNINVFNTSNFQALPVISTPGPVSSVAFNNANSTVYASINDTGASGIFSYNTQTQEPGQFVSLPDFPSKIGACPCGTKLFVPVADAGSASIQEVSLIGAPLSSIGIAAGARSIGIGISPNGSHAFLADPASGIIIVQTLTSTIESTVATPVQINSNVSGDFAGFVGINPVAYVPNGENIAVLRTPALNAPNINLNSQNGNISVAAGPASNLITNSGLATVVTSNSSLVSGVAGNPAGSSAGTQMQYATTSSIIFNSPVSAAGMDMHAMYGTFTNAADNIIFNAGGAFTIASPNILNNGLIELNSLAGSDAVILLQSPTGALNLTLGNNSAVSVQADNIGELRLNPAGGSSINVSGNGTLAAGSFGFPGAGSVVINGIAGNYTVNISINELAADLALSSVNNSVIGTLNNPSQISVITNSGDISIASTIDTSKVSGSGGSINLQALGGFFQTSFSAADSPLISTGSGAGTRAGNINISGRDGIFILGEITANGINGANGGNITLTSPEFIATCNCGFGAISATATGGGNGGNINVSSQFLQIDSINLNGSSFDVSSDLGNGGVINITNTAEFDPLVIGCPFCNSISGDLLANGVNGGRINISVAAGLEIETGLQISANGSTGAGGVVQILGIPGQTLNVINSGLISATNNNDNSGIVGFNSFFEGGVNLTSCGCSGSVHAGNFVAFGNLDPLTALPINPIFFPATDLFEYGSIFADLGGSIIGNRIAVGRAPAPVTALPSLSLATRENRAEFQNISFRQPEPLPNTSISAIDQTPEALRTTIRYFPESTDKSDNGIWTALAFNADSKALLEQGVEAGAGQSKNDLVLNKGNVLCIAREKINLHTPAGEFKIFPGSVVLVMVSPEESSIFDLHDEIFNSPLAVVGGRRSKLAVGQQLLVSKLKSPRFNGKIAYRQNQLLAQEQGLEIHSAQFSLASALSSIRTLKKLQISKSSDERRVFAQIFKNAAIMSVVGTRFGQYYAK